MWKIKLFSVTLIEHIIIEIISTFGNYWQIFFSVYEIIILHRLCQ